MAAKNTLKKFHLVHVRPDNHILHICHGDTRRAQVLCDVVQGRGEGAEGAGGEGGSAGGEAEEEGHRGERKIGKRT